MYAVIRTGGKQHRVTKGDRLRVDKLTGDVGAEIKLDDVLLLGGDGEPKVGQPQVTGATVTAKIVSQGKGPKIRSFKRRRRKGYHRTVGHRQDFTELEITGIQG